MPPDDRAAETFLDRTWRNLRSAWQEIAQSVRGGRTTPPAPDLPDTDAQLVRQQMEDCLAARGGEVSARARAAGLGRTYLSLNPTGRQRFLKLLASSFDVERGKVEAAVQSYLRAENDAERREADQALRQALDAPRRRLLTQFNALPEGIKFLVDMRAELLALSGDDDDLNGLEADLKSLLAAWFDVGFLELRQITWGASAALLERLIAYEAVHEIHGWADLKDRLDSDRRCFAYFHPRMPDEPLIFVEVALVAGLADNIQSLLDLRAPVQEASRADTAIFYSISNAQRGLAGISFGNFLIKRVVDRLRQEFPGLKTFATLSPIPGFRGWLRRQLAKDEPILLPAERKALVQFEKSVEKASDGALLARRLAHLLEREDWGRDDGLSDTVRPALMRLCARYLLAEKAGKGRRALDPVAHFHLTNGARVERLNWLGDRSRRGIEQSAGLMVNYLYKLDDINTNHEAYSGEGKIAASSAVRGLWKP